MQSCLVVYQQIPLHPSREKSILDIDESFLWNLWKVHQPQLYLTSNHIHYMDLHWSWSARTGSHSEMCMDAPEIFVTENEDRYGKILETTTESRAIKQDIQHQRQTLMHNNDILESWNSSSIYEVVKLSFFRSMSKTKKGEVSRVPALFTLLSKLRYLEKQKWLVSKLYVFWVRVLGRNMY